MSNYYNDVKLTNFTPAEKSISLGEQLDKWGSKLVKPYGASFGGRSYSANLTNREISSNAGLVSKRAPSIANKIQVRIGVSLKEIGALFSSEVKAKYQLIGPDKQKEAAFDKLTPHKTISCKKTRKKEGREIEIDNCIAMLLCFLCCIAIAPAYSSRRTYIY